MTEDDSPASSTRRSDLAGVDRIARWSRTTAHERQLNFVRRNWRGLLPMLIATLIGTIIPILLPMDGTLFLSGLALASGVWVTITFVVLLTGTAPMIVGDIAEQWTAEELRTLEPLGWHLVNGLKLTANEDIDHVVVGPGGLLVVETKWRSSPWDPTRARDGISIDAAAQVSRTARQVALWLRPAIGDAPVHRAVFAWGTGVIATEHDLITIGNVAIVPGQRCEEWLSQLPQGHLGTDTINQAMSMIEKHIERRELAGIDAPAPRRWFSTLTRWTIQYLTFSAVLFIGFALTSELIKQLDFWIASAITAGALALPGLALKRNARLRPYANAWLVGLATLMSWYLIFWAAETLQGNR